MEERIIFDNENGTIFKEIRIIERVPVNPLEDNKPLTVKEFKLNKVESQSWAIISIAVTLLSILITLIMLMQTTKI